MPIAGSYRSIDFSLSNMSNSHIQKVGVFTQYNARSLNEHLNSSNGGISDVNRAVCSFSPLRLRRTTAIGTEELQTLFIRTCLS